jgi:hypothetical protein
MLGFAVILITGLFLVFLPSNKVVGPVQTFLSLQQLAVLLAVTTPFINSPDWVVRLNEVVVVQQP